MICTKVSNISRLLGLRLNQNAVARRAFTASTSLRANTLMETSGFSDTQLDVREAIAKICSKYPDVSYSGSNCHNFSLNMPGILGKA